MASEVGYFVAFFVLRRRKLGSCCYCNVGHTLAHAKAAGQGRRVARASSDDMSYWQSAGADQCEMLKLCVCTSLALMRVALLLQCYWGSSHLALHAGSRTVTLHLLFA